MGFIDCDSHVIENDDTWSYLSGAEAQFKPLRVSLPQQNLGVQGRAAAPPIDIWLAGDTWVTALPPDGNPRGNANTWDPSTTGLSDPAARIADLDSLGIDAQLLLSTFFIGVEAVNPAVDVALARSYNRWMADRAGGDVGRRLPWALRAPLSSMQDALAEITFGKEHGAAGAQIHGLELGLYLSDPYFVPFLEHLNDLEMAVFVHVGEYVRRIDNQLIGRIIPAPAAMTRQLFPLMAGFHAVLASDFERRFPKLRWGFLEGGATWVPAVLQMDSRLRSSASQTDFLKLTPVTPEVLEAKQVFVSCEAEEDIPYLTSLLGESVLVTGTDYCHNDLGSELGAHTSITRRPDVPEPIARKITDTNGRRLLGIPEDFQPAPRELRDMPHTRGASTADGSPLIYHTIERPQPAHA